MRERDEAPATERSIRAARNACRTSSLESRSPSVYDFRIK
jgi:hypothetical protein